MKIMKKKLSFLLIVLLTVTLSISEEIILAEDTNVVTTDTGEQTSINSLEISNLGAVMGYDKDLNPLHPKVIIPTKSKDGKTINGISARVFKDQGITEVILPDTITSIGQSAFENNQITKVDFPSGNFRILENAFKNNAFTEITITSNMDMSSVSGGVFSNNTQLKSVKFKDGVTSVSDSIFRNSAVENVTFSDTIKTINQYAFSGTKIEKVILPAKLEVIYSGAFYQSKLKEVIIPDTVKDIHSSAFQECQIEKVVLSKNLQTIYDQCFGGNKIKELDIPASLKKVAARSFWKNQIEKVTFHEGLEVIDDSAFCYNKIKKVVIPKGTKEISSVAFGQNEIESVTIGEGVEKIANQAFVLNKISSLKLPSTLKTVGSQAFAANRLGYVNMPSGVTTLATDAFLQQRNVASEYVIRDGKYMYQLSKDIDANHITDVKGYVDTTVKNGDFNTELKQFTSSEPLTKITYNVNLSSDTVTAKMDVWLVFSMKKHHIIFKDYDGSILNELDIEDSQSINELPKVTRVGYTFIGWNHETDNIQTDMTITAQYKKQPSVKTEDVRLEKGSLFIPKDYIEAIDADGHKIENIAIIKNDINVNKAGTYIVEYKVTDKWGGTTTGSYQVTVYTKVFKETQIVNNETQITARGTFEENSRLVVLLVASNKNALYEHIDNQTVLGSYEVKIIGNYKGKIQIDFPIERQYEGYTVYIRHMKQDGTVELFTRTAKDGKVSVEVNELSPFIVTIDKSNINEGLPPVSPPLKDKVDTGDQTSVLVWVAGMFITASLMFGIYLRRVSKVK